MCYYLKTIILYQGGKRMIIADLIALGVIMFITIVGLSSGFSGGLKFFTKGVFGKIIAVVASYFLYGLVIDLPFVQKLLEEFVKFMASQDNFVCNMLLQLRIDLIVFAVALVVVVQILNAVVVDVLCGIFEGENTVIKVFNKALGLALYLFMTFAFVLIIFQIISLIDHQGFASYLSGSIMGLDGLFNNNPLLSIIKSINFGNMLK
jgi:hypothetical protein